MTSEFKTDKSVKGLECAREISPMVKKYYEDARKAKEEGKKVAYCTAYYPGELLSAMDIVPLYPENFSAACAAKQISPKAMEVTESRGYSFDLCSYFKCHIGYYFAAETLPRPPGGGMVPPDMILGMENNCMTHCKWMRVLERYYKVPCHCMLLPIKPKRMFEHKIEEHFMEFAMVQFKDLVSFLERQTGKKLDIDRLKETVKLSHLASIFYDQCYEYRKTVPCPASAQDFSSTMMPLVVLKGQAIQADFNERLSREMGQRAKAGIGAIPSERFRLLFDGIPPWYTLGFYNYFDKFDAVFAYEHYNCKLITRTMDASRPLESLALKYLDYHMHWSFYERADCIVRAALDYFIDGAILGMNKSCRMWCAFEPYLEKRLKEEAGIPCILLEYDHSDPRVYSDAEVKGRIDAFMEVVAQHKEQREARVK